MCVVKSKGDRGAKARARSVCSCGPGRGACARVVQAEVRVVRVERHGGGAVCGVCVAPLGVCPFPTPDTECCGQRTRKESSIHKEKNAPANRAGFFCLMCWVLRSSKNIWESSMFPRISSVSYPTKLTHLASVVLEHAPFDIARDTLSVPRSQLCLLALSAIRKATLCVCACASCCPSYSASPSFPRLPWPWLRAVPPPGIPLKTKPK